MYRALVIAFLLAIVTGFYSSVLAQTYGGSPASEPTSMAIEAYNSVNAAPIPSGSFCLGFPCPGGSPALNKYKQEAEAAEIARAEQERLAFERMMMTPPLSEDSMGKPESQPEYYTPDTSFNCGSMTSCSGFSGCSSMSSSCGSMSSSCGSYSSCGGGMSSSCGSMSSSCGGYSSCGGGMSSSCGGMSSSSCGGSVCDGY